METAFAKQPFVMSHRVLLVHFRPGVASALLKLSLLMNVAQGPAKQHCCLQATRQGVCRELCDVTKGMLVSWVLVFPSETVLQPGGCLFIYFFIPLCQTCASC